MLAEISERDGVCRTVRAAMIQLGKHCQAVSASKNGSRRKSRTESVDDGRRDRGARGCEVGTWVERCCIGGRSAGIAVESQGHGVNVS
eukprot:1071730-Rhodomonas_salina.1